MRQIKFRQRVRNNWHYWGFVDDHGYLVFKGIEGNLSTIEEALKNSQQFTGLHDKNGKEIWEGDILSFSCNYARDNGKIDRIVMFSNGCFIIDQLPLAGGNFVGIEVIGNIYEKKRTKDGTGGEDGNK